MLEWTTTPDPAEKKVHIELFRYGASPAIIRANRGDSLTVTFSTRDTGHSFFLQDYRIDAKVTPGSEMLEVRDPLRATEPPRDLQELKLTAGNPGLWGHLVSASRFRCHVYCGPMHGFEQGDLIVRPNFLLTTSLGLLIALVIIGYLRVGWDTPHVGASPPSVIDLNRRWPWLDKLLKWRPLQFGLTLPVLAGFTVIVLAGLFGTKVGGRNIAVMMTWAVWMTLLAVVLVPLGTRLWCVVCPVPFLGEVLQRGAVSETRSSTKKGRYGNRFFGLGRRWPRALRGPWIRLAAFVGLGSLSGDPWPANPVGRR